MVARQGVADDYCIGIVGIERAVGFINQVELRQHLATFQGEWLGEVRGLGGNDADGCGI